MEAGAARLVFRTLSAPRQCEVRELEAIALRDPVLAGSLLGVANSALFSCERRVSSVRRAIAAVGVDEARKIMLAAAVRPLFASAGLQRIWSHSLSSAPLCSALAHHTGLLTADEGLLFGLVHDIGAVARHMDDVVCINRRIHVHQRPPIGRLGLESTFGCAVEYLFHGEIPHRVVKTHDD